MWMDFLILDLSIKPYVLEIKAFGGECFFVSFIFKKMGFYFCGSPFEGWSTPFMGYIWLSEWSTEQKKKILKATKKFIFKTTKCVYIQISDWDITVNQAKDMKLKHYIVKTPIIDISRSEEEMFSSFKVDVRTNCRNFEKRGGVFCRIEPSLRFSSEHYKQLIDVFDKQNMNVPYHQKKIDNLMNIFSYYPQNIICEEVLEPENNNSIASGIFLLYKDYCYFFGAASYRQYQLLRPNEYIIWKAILEAKEKGCNCFDMCGVRKYKEKFMPQIDSHPVFYFEKLPFLYQLKKIFKKREMSKRGK